MIGFFEKPYNEAKLRPRELYDNFSPEFDPSSPKKYIYGLYYDANSPERQEIIDCEARQAKFVRDINDLLKLTAAKSSPFFNIDVARHFLNILQGNVTCTSAFA